MDESHEIQIAAIDASRRGKVLVRLAVPFYCRLVDMIIWDRDSLTPTVVRSFSFQSSVFIGPYRATGFARTNSACGARRILGHGRSPTVVVFYEAAVISPLG